MSGIDENDNNNSTETVYYQASLAQHCRLLYHKTLNSCTSLLYVLAFIASQLSSPLIKVLCL